MFEEEATRILGREVRVGGAVNVRLLPAPYASFERCGADPTGLSGEPFFRAESFTLWLSAPPLLRGVLEANKIELRRPVLRLALDEEGTGNWSRLTVTRGALPFVPAGVTLQSVRILDGTLAVHASNGASSSGSTNSAASSPRIRSTVPTSSRAPRAGEAARREIRRHVRAAARRAVRFKASVRAQTDNTYTLDGRASDLRARPRIEGELTAKIAVAPQARGRPGRAAGAGRRRRRRGARPLMRGGSWRWTRLSSGSKTSP